MQNQTISFLKKKGIHFAILLAASILLGYLLLVLAYCIPSEKFLMGGANSIQIFQQEGTYPTILSGYPNSQLDNYTDGSMLNNAIYAGTESPFIKAAACYRYQYEDQNPMEAFISYLWMDESYSVASCPRYWHGFLIILKPLLTFMNYSDIRVLNQFFQLLLLGALIWQFAKKQLQQYILPLLLSVFFLMPAAVSMSLQYSSVYNITLLSAFFLLLFAEKIEENNLYAELFLMTGILTSYFDLLTFPLLSLGIPLIIAILLKQKKEAQAKELLLCIIAYSFCWGLGYAGMWAGKWLIAILVLGAGTFAEVTYAMQMRSLKGASSDGLSVAAVIQNNIIFFQKPVYRISFLVMTACYAIQALIHKTKPVVFLKKAVPFVLILLMPFAWYTVTAGHAYVHSWFTHRTLVIGVFAWGCLMAGELSAQKTCNRN